ncbi:MAG: TraB/GumN family protein [Saprospiraceae bacterium]|nr:TraB/GumN family protein [Saprospiraceae bacterium]
MKKKILLLLMPLYLLYGGLTAQEPTILLLGTTHQFTDTVDVFADIRNQIKDFAPDMICIENIPTWDTLSLRNIWSDIFPVATRLRQEQKLETVDLPSLQGQLLESLQSSPDNPRLHAQLANVYYAQHNFYNAYYHWVELARLLEKSDEVDQALIPHLALDSIYLRVAKRQSRTEYGHIVFPVAAELGIHHLESIDERGEDPAFQKHSKKLFKRLIFNLKIFKAMKIYKKEQKKLIDAPGDEVMAYLNSEAFRSFLEGVIEELPTRWSRSKKTKELIRLWEERNERMADRIEDLIEVKRPERVLVVFGAAHVPSVKPFLEQTDRYQVLTYDEWVNGKPHPRGE